MPPTGAKFQGCGTSRATAPKITSVIATGLRFTFSMRSPSNLIVALPGGGAVGLPKNFGYPKSMTGPAAPHKQSIAQPVQIAHDGQVHGLFARQRHADPLRAPANRTAYVQLGIQSAAAR